MLSQIYSIIWLSVVFALAVFVLLLVARLIFNYSDPNPFGASGRLGFKIRKITEKFVYPAARLLAQFRVDVRLAPLVTMFISIVVAYFGLRIIGETFSVLSSLADSIAAGNIKAITGIILYALIDIFILFIFIRFVSTWFVFTRKTFLAFVQRVTDPVLIPVRRLIPPVGMFDISAMILLILLGFLQTIIRNVFGF
ncbi:MAG: YggT family protein [Acidobacteriota bacterium]|nr:YggT family protein [Acidobacteriota bacterium]